MEEASKGDKAEKDDEEEPPAIEFMCPWNQSVKNGFHPSTLLAPRHASLTSLIPFGSFQHMCRCRAGMPHHAICTVCATAMCGACHVCTCARRCLDAFSLYSFTFEF